MSHTKTFSRLLVLAAVMVLPIRAEAQKNEDDPAIERVVSVFANGLGQVWERRPMALSPGSASVLLTHISQRTIAESVRLTGAGGDVTIREISLNRALLTPQALLERYLGREIGVIKVHPTTGEERMVPATVVSLAGGVVMRVNGRLETGMPGRLAFPDESFGLPPRPVLSANLQAAAGVRGLTLTYLTDGLTWAVDYTAQLTADGENLELTGWASLQNDTGVALDATQVRLVAGQINRASHARLAKAPLQARMMASESVAADASGLPTQQAVGAAHVYTLAGAVKLADGERKQVALVQAARVPVTETLVSAGHPVVFGPQRGEPRPDHPELRLSFDNKSLVADGLPLPAGIVRVYRQAPGGPPLFSGEDHMTDTPDGEKVELTLGRAFDVTVRRQQAGFKRLDAQGRNVEAGFKIEIRNGRDKPARVRIDENLPGDWTIVEEVGQDGMDAISKHERVGGQARWSMVVPAKGKAFLAYRVRVLR